MVRGCIISSELALKKGLFRVNELTLKKGYLGLSKGVQHSEFALKRSYLGLVILNIHLKMIENKYDYKKALLKDLMKNIPNSFIIEVCTSAFFNILLIPSRWYNDQVAQLSENEIHVLPSIQLFNTSQSVPTHSNLNLKYSYPDIIHGGNIFTPELKENITDC
uniref:Uncharacterized protein n=1 Tax=Rhizophagus irregularis (strain DAOM 181602 / DAOM 197198 / MUCL 43194) TaxID=747089 RepID=U9TSB5_RHIID